MPEKRHRPRWPRRLIIGVVTVVVLFIAADRIGAAVAEHKAGELMQRSQGLAERPDVEVHGFPFLTQLVSGHYPRVDVTAGDVPVRGAAALVLDRLVVRLHDVRVSSDFDSATAAHAEASATVGYAELSELVGFVVTGTDAGGLTASYTATIAGLRVSARAGLHVQVDGDSLRLSHATISFDGTDVAVPKGVSDAVSSALDKAISFAGLPFGIRLTGVAVHAEGVEVQFAGDELAYHRGQS